MLVPEGFGQLPEYSSLSFCGKKARGRARASSNDIFGPVRLRGEWLFGFGARVAGEQCAQSFLWGKPLVENGVYCIDDRGAHAGVAGGVVNRFGIGDAFGDHGHGREDGRERRSPAEGLADAVIPAMFAVAGDDEVADAAEPLEGSGGTAHGGAEADHFGQAAGDEGGAGIIAEAEAAGEAAGDGKDVFDGGAPFDADEVIAGIGSEPGQGDEVLEAAGDELIGAADDGGGGLATCDFLGVIGSGEDGYRLGGHGVAQQLGHAQAGSIFDAFDAADEWGFWREREGGQLLGHGADGFGRDDDEDGVAGGEVGEGGGGADVVWEDDIWEVAGVLVKRVNGGDDAGFASPDDDFVGVACEQDGQCGAPAAAADDADLFHMSGSGHGLGLERERVAWSDEGSGVGADLIP